MPWRENKGVANLDGIYTDGLGLPVGKKSLEEIFNKIWPEARNQSADLRRNLYGNKIFKKILTENALEYLAFGKDFYGDRLTGSKS